MRQIPYEELKTIPKEETIAYFKTLIRYSRPALGRPPN